MEERGEPNGGAFAQTHPSPPPLLASAAATSAFPTGAEVPPAPLGAAVSGDSSVELADGGGDALLFPLNPPSHLEIDACGIGEPEHLLQGEPAKAATVVLTDELREKIVRQVEYYFSDENLPTDYFLLNHIKKNKKGFVPVQMIATFRKMKKLVQDNSLITSALRTSSKLVVSSDGKKVRRLHPISDNENEDANLCTVIVRNLPENCSQDYLQKMFESVGNVKRITIEGHPPKADGSKMNGEWTLATYKMHAFVEFHTTEAAKKAVVSLNDESNWRTGLRVEPLVKQVGKHGQTQKGRKSLENLHTSEASNTSREDSDINSSEQPNGTVDKEEKHVLLGKSDPKVQSMRRGRQFHAEGQGRGRVASGVRIEMLSRTTLGPKMPDGTKGFTMGRGKPITSIRKDIVEIH